MAWAPEASYQAVPVKAGDRRRLTLLVELGATLTTLCRITGQADSSSLCGRASEVFPVLEAVKVKALAVLYP